MSHPRKLSTRRLELLTHHIEQVHEIVELGWEPETDIGLGLAGLNYHLSRIVGLANVLGLDVASMRDDLEEPLWPISKVEE